VSDDPMERFIAHSPPIDDVREEAARCASETARWERGERGPLRMPSGLIAGEFSDAAFGVAAEVAMEVAGAMKAAGQRPGVHLPWSVAATLLRAGWQRGQRVLAHRVGKGGPS
jgi:hypothetical protein